LCILVSKISTIHPFEFQVIGKSKKLQEDLSHYYYYYYGLVQFIKFESTYFEWGCKLAAKNVNNYQQESFMEEH
jgi:hypothetical protein